MEGHAAPRAPRCTRCKRQSALILDGVYYCSEHGLVVVLERLEHEELPIAS